MNLRAFYLVLIIVALVASCSRYKGVYRFENYKRTTKSWKYPELLFCAPGLSGKTILMDTISGVVLRRTRFVNGFGPFGIEINHTKTKIYDSTGHKIMVVKQ